MFCKVWYKLRKNSMPFNGLVPFSLYVHLDVFQHLCVCQCPSTGWYHFHLLVQHRKDFQMTMCQCPSTDWYHFHHITNEKGEIICCVNALQRTGTIFTLAFWNALFTLVRGTRFPQDFSKIGKLSVFCQFFGFFGIFISIP